MKIGILTFHNAHNYGAVLQAYALKKFLKKKYTDVSVIDYKNETLEQKYQLKQQLVVGKKDVVFPWRWKRVFDRKKKIDYSKEQWEIQWSSFEEFINTEILGESNDDVIFDNYDVIIFGSDQIWEKKITNGYDLIYFGAFRFNGKKISYAASMTDSIIEKKDEDLFKKYLYDFDALSVREESIANVLSKLLNKNVDTMIDPSFLLDKTEYNEIIDQEFIPNKDKYILAYYVSENKEMSEYVSELAKANEMKVVEIHYYDLPELDKTYQYSNLGPRQFLKCFKEADFVVTNSFHGTAFSIIYEKQFYTYYLNNNRVESLLKLYGINGNNQYKTKTMKLYKNIDYKAVSNYKTKLREKAMTYLENSIGE